MLCILNCSVNGLTLIVSGPDPTSGYGCRVVCSNSKYVLPNVVLDDIISKLRSSGLLNGVFCDLVMLIDLSVTFLG